MKGTSTFTDGASNQTNLTSLSQSDAKGGAIHFAKDLFRKVKTLFFQEGVSERVDNIMSIEQSVDIIQPQNINFGRNKIIETTGPAFGINRESQISHTNYQLNIQQMNLFTYLRRAVTSSEESLSGQFLEQFRNFLSVIVGTAPDNNAPLGTPKRDFGILSNLGGQQLLSGKLFNSPAMRSWASVMFLTLFTAFGALAQVTGATTPVNPPDLSVKKTISNQNPTLGADVTYTIKVQNSGAAATGVELTDLLPAGVTVKTVSVSAGTQTRSSSSIVWNVGAVAAGTVATPTELTMTIVATTTARGLHFNVAEITKQNETDFDSTPNNKDFNEDDIDAVCFSIEDYWYKGDEFTINVPTGYTNIAWTRKVGTGAAVAVTASTPGVILNSDGSLVVTNITAYTEFAFTASNKNCPVGGCCPAKFIPGPYGSISDFVFTDTNGDGKQDLGELGVAGVKVQLYKADGVTLVDEVTTSSNGKYLFDSLFTDTYKVKFLLPSGQTFSPSKQTGTGFTDVNDSDAGTDGFTSVISIDVEKTGKDKDNFDVDAGLIGNVGSIGDFVWRDDNGNGIQDAGEPGIGGLTVNLYKGGVLFTSTTTDPVTGKYNFPNLGSGSYEVEFIASPQSRFTKLAGSGDQTTDSNAQPNGKSGLITIDVTKAPTDILRNNPTIDAGIIPLGSIGDFVFNDNNGNGIQDSGEAGAINVKVTLTDKDGNIITTTTTDGTGKYEFIVPSGQYIIVFDKPAGSTFTQTGKGTPSTDSDADGTTGKSGIITIDATKPVGDPARNNKDVDAGVIPICNINAGTLATATPNFCLPATGGVVLTATVATSPTVPTAYSVRYVLTKGSDLVIQQVANNPTFTVTTSGEYRIHTLVFDGNSANANFLDLSVVVLGTTKAADVLGIVTTNKLCAALDVTGIKFNVNPNVAAGTLTTITPNFCLPATGGVVLTATTATSPTVPTGYSVRYVLTKGADLVIQQVANTPTFTVTTTGEYRIHTLVFDGNSASSNFLDLSVVVLGTTKAADVLGIVTTNKLCAALDVTGAKFNVNPVPDAPVFTAKTVCAGEKVTIGSTDPVSTGISYAWFASATATTPFATTQSIEVSPSVTTTYYVETTLVTPNACTSKRGSVVVTVNPKPETPVAKSTLTNDCTKNLQTVNLADAITTTPAGSVVEWHVANDPASAIITNTTTAGAGTYYAFAKSTAGGCYSVVSATVVVTITTCTCQNPATVSVAPLAAICGNTTTAVQLAATIGGGATGGTWTSTGTGTFDNATSVTAKYTPSAGDVANGSVELTFTTNDPDGADTKCIAAVAKTTLSLKAKPASPINLECDKEICLGESNKLFAASLGNTIKWYATATSNTSVGQADEKGFLVVTPTAEGTYTYYAESITPDGCVSERSSVSFIVKKCLTDLAVIKKVVDAPDAQSTPSYLLGQTISYSIEAQNIGTAKATDVKVDDILPAGATYVNSTPSGAYNNTTGVWTIGDLTAGSTKALLIQVTFNRTGNVVNTAKISGTNEDPTKLGNNTSTVTTPVIDLADLSLTKVVNKSTVNVGEDVEYTITVLNSGPNTATNVEVKDILPAGLTFVSSSTLANNAGTVTGTVASLAKGASTSFKFTAKVNVAGAIKNVAEISKSDQKDLDSTPGNVSTKPDEDDDDSADINSTKACDVTPPVADCKRKEICIGESTLITATGCTDGTVVWSTGATGTSITVSPKVNSSYTAYCKKSEDCKSDPSNEVRVTVITISAPLLSASPSKICAGESVTLTARGCDGVIEWQTNPVQTTPSITVTPLTSNTYTAVCKQFGCVSKPGSVDVIVTPKPKAPEVLCEKEELCPGEDMTLTATNCNGQVKWSTGQETTTIVVKPTVTTSYTVTCTVNGCTSDVSKAFVITVKPIAVPTITVTNTVICAGSSTNLTATGCTGKVTWYYDDKTLTGATITVKPNTTTTYTATCSSVYCISEKSTPVTVTVENPAPPVVSSGTSTICSGSSVELTATGCSGTVTWSPGGLTGNKITVMPTASTSYTATCTIGICVSPVSNKRDITVTDFAKPTITADRLTVCAGTSITLTSNGCNGTVTWSDGITGSPRTITPTADVKYTATCESATCKSDKSNELSIKVNTAPTAPAIACLKPEICAGESTTLTATNCTGTVKWSDGQTGASIIVKPSTTTTYTAVCVTNSTCESVKSNEKIITVNPAVVLNLVASASPANVCSGSEATLTLTGCTGTVTWTGNLTGASIKVRPTATTTYTATCSGVACATDASANVRVTVLPGATTPTIAASGTQICVGGEVTLTANNCNGTVLWSNSATTAAITVKPMVTTTYTVQCKVEGCGDPKTSEPVVVRVGNPDAPTISTTPTSVCAGGSVVLTATGCAGGTIVWSDGKTGVSITENVNATTTYSAICKVGTCNSPESNKVTVTVTVPSVPTISCATNTICAGTEITLVATGCEGTVKWSDGQTGAIVKSSPSRTTDYSATCTIGTCTSAPSSIATVNVGNPPAPTIVCNATSICQGIQITLTGSNCSGTIVWNDGQVGNVITAKPNATTKYTAICKLDKCESGRSNEITVTVGAGGVTPRTKNLNNVCPFITVDLAGGVTSLSTGTYEYRTGPLPSSPLVTNPNAVGTGTYYVFEKTGAGCFSAPGVINVFVNADCTPVDCATSPATASAGADATICAEKTYKLAGTFGGAAKFVTWTTSGTGTFDNPMSPTATYRSSLADVIAGTVRLTITTNDPDGTGACTAASSSMTLTMQGVKFKPTVSVAGNLNTCSADKVVLTGAVSPSGTTFGYKWFKVGSTTEIASTRSITVEASGSYFYKIVDANKCCSIESDTVAVNYFTAPSAPIANSVKIDRGTTIDLTKLVVSNTPAGATLIFKIGAAVTSATVANPSAVGAGVYYACYRSAQGCFSEATKITVENKDGGTRPTDADIQITVTTENNIALDSTVKITITVKNNGPATAKNVTVSAPIPSGLTYVSQTGGLVRNGNLLNGSIDSLISGGVKVYTWVGKISGGTTSVIVGATGGSTNPDPNPSNNNGSNPNGNVVVTVPAPNSADIVVTIRTDKTNYAVGDTVTTTIKVTNLGPATAKNVSVSHEIPNQLTYVSQTGGLVRTGSILTGRLDSLVRGGMKEYVYKSVLTGTGSVVLVGTGTSNNPDPNPNNNNGSNNGTTPTGTIVINPPVPTGADVVISVTTDKTNFAIGDTVTVTIKVTNLGPATAKGINVSSTIPSTILNYVSQTGGLTRTGNVLSASIDSLVRDGMKIYTYRATVIGSGTTPITATGTTTTTDPNPSNNNGSGTGRVTITTGTPPPPPPPANSADVVITITTDKTNYAVGDTVTTTIKVTNLGPATAKNISVFSALPGTLTYIDQTGGLVRTGNILTATIASLDKDGMVTYTYRGKLTSPGETIIAAGGTSTTPDPNPGNNNGTGAGTTTINPGGVDLTLADVAVVITADKTTAKVGENVNFLLTLTNNGPATAKQVSLLNNIPAGLTFVSSSTGQTLENGGIIVNLDSLERGQTRTYAYVARMNVTTNVVNTVSANSLKDGIAPNNFSFVTINGTGETPPPRRGAELAVNLSSDIQLIAKDDEVTFTIKVTNNGPETATNVVVDNILPKQLSYISGQTTKLGDTLRAAVASIPVGSMVSFTYKAKVEKDTVISNTASITKSTPVDTILTNNTSTVILVPASDTTKADLGVLITANSNLPYKVGENITYTITLINNGGGRGRNIELCSAIPAGLTFVSSTNGIVRTADSLKIKVDTISKGLVRIYTFITKAPTAGSFTASVNVCKNGKTDLITPNNTSSVTIRVEEPATDCKLGLAMAVADTVKISDGVYDVTYRLIAKNFCKDTLKNVTLVSNLESTFRLPVTYELRGIPTISAGTRLVVNELFSKTDSALVKPASFMLPEAVDTIKYTVRVTLNGNKGPFFSQSTVTGRKPDNTVLTAKSSDGTNVNGTPSRTVLRFDLPNTRIGLAKEVITTGLKNDSTTFWTVPYRIRVVNMGSDTVKQVSVKDSLAGVFTAKGAVIIGKPIVTGTPGLTVNKNYTGSGDNTNLLNPDSSFIVKGDTAIIDLVVRVNVADATDPDKVFNNVAVGTATGKDKAVYTDISTNGNNPDPDGDKDPSDDNVATPVTLKSLISNTGPLGIALFADTISQGDITLCKVMFTMTVKNYGTTDLTKVNLCHNFLNTLGKDASSVELVGIPTVFRGNAKINPLFNGKTDSLLVKVDSSSIAVGDSIVLSYIVDIRGLTNDTLFTHATGKAVSGRDTVSTRSVDGINPDRNGDGKVDAASDTRIICPDALITTADLFIPQGFSPNGDGQNDRFVIQGVKPTEQVELVIFNRYGGVVYASQDYKNDWNGTSNQGVKVIGDGQGLPDGTYFYCVTRSLRADGSKVDLKPIVRYITLMR
jgi:large repetitive protein